MSTKLRTKKKPLADKMRRFIQNSQKWHKNDIS